jgi:hypothetical protein
VAWAGTTLFVVIGMGLLLLLLPLPPLLFCVHFYDAVSRQLSILPINFGFFRFPYHFSSLWPCESST